MQLDISHVFVDLHKRQIMAGTGIAATLGTIAAEVLTANISGVDAAEKRRRVQLARRIIETREPSIDLPVEDVALIKQLIGELCSPLIVDSAFDAIDNPRPKLSVVPNA